MSHCRDPSIVRHSRIIPRSMPKMFVLLLLVRRPSILSFVATCLLIVGVISAFARPEVATRRRERAGALVNMLVLAQCESQCYLDPKNSAAISIQVNDQNFTIYECITNDCHQCVNATLRPISDLDDCYAFCGKQDSCRHSCNCVSRHESQGVGRSDTMAVPLTPTLACQDVTSSTWPTSRSDNQSAALEVQVVIVNGIVLPHHVTTRVPTVFVIQVRRKSTRSDAVSNWELIGKTNRPFLEVSDLAPAVFYQFRTQSVAPDGILATSNVSDWRQTLPANVTLEPPTQLVHISTYTEGRDLVATFIWKPPLENFCFYEVFWFHPNGYQVANKDVFLPINRSEVKLTGLNFGANYTLQMVTRSGDGKMESRKVEVNFITGSCLATFGTNFTLCGPGPPLDFIFGTASHGERESDDTAPVVLSWNAPFAATDANCVLYYDVKLTKVVSFTNLPFVAPFVFESSVPGNTSQVIVDGVPLSSNYVASVTAVSQGGHGESAVTQFTLPANEVRRENETSALLIILVASPCFLSIVVAFVCIVAYRSHQRRLAKSIRDHYFESLERSQPLDKYELACGKHSMTSSSFPAFEIDFHTLLLGDVIGRGAFGLVRKAQMCKPFTLWQNVAVKMLHPGYSEQDERYLMEEIDMMNSVGQHPNLVSLIAYCITKPNVCLVVEHCPYGDLQNYLRAFRNKHFNKSFNDSGIVDQHNCVVQETSLEDSSLSLFSEDCSECENRILPLSKVGRGIEPRNSNFDCDLVDGKEAVTLSSNDLLSFSRQISMGMEYLSQNKLVHRDLAARNVLVYNRKLVKVSDFGLMRDVYESNVYRRKTDGKLPVKWMAYESIFDQVFTTKSDVWSFGVLLYEIITLGGVPYAGIGNIELVELLKTNYRMEKPANCDDTLYAMMTSCWQNNPSNRPNFTELRHQLESILENSLNYLILDLSFDEDNYYKIMRKTRSTTRSVSTTCGASTMTGNLNSSINESSAEA